VRAGLWLALLGGPPTVQTALAAHSRGVGQLIAAAVAAEAGRIVVGLGGSSCTDGGRGMIEELAAYAREHKRIELGGSAQAAGGRRAHRASDVEHPLLGPMGAAAVFGPQKGADPDTVRDLEQRLSDWAVELNAAAGRTVSDEAGAGAAGGIGAGLLALGAAANPVPR
jgi:glycerate kinase